MEEGTGGRSKGRERRKEARGKNTAQIENRTGSVRVSFRALVIYSSFQSSHKIHQTGSDNQSDSPLSADPGPKARLVIKGT